MQKNSTRSYEKYLEMIKEKGGDPKKAMSEKDYYLKYPEAKPKSTSQTSEIKEKPGSGIPESVGRTKLDPSFAPQEKPQEKKFPSEKVFGAIINMVRKPEYKSQMDSASTHRLLNTQGHKITDFINYLFEGLKANKVNFDDISHFEDLGLINKDFTKRRLKIHDMENLVPPKYYDRYDIKHVDDYKSKIFLAVKIANFLSKSPKR